MRANDRDTALGLLHGLARFAFTESGGVRQLEGYDPAEFRLRLGPDSFPPEDRREDRLLRCAAQYLP